MLMLNESCRNVHVSVIAWVCRYKTEEVPGFAFMMSHWRSFLITFYLQEHSSVALMEHEDLRLM